MTQTPVSAASPFRLRVAVAFLSASLAAACFAPAAQAGTGSALPPAALFSPAEEAAAFLGLPYRPDGALDEAGRWTLFARPETTLDTPGLNCSGLVVAAARKALRRPLALDQALRDRRGDSGPGAPQEQDWDFGFDLVLNVSEGLARQVLLPEGREAVPEDADGASLRGFALDNAASWEKILPLLRADRVCLLSFSRLRRGGLLHHHVGLLLKDDAGHVWFEQATRKGGVGRMDMAAPGGIERFLAQQRQWPGTDARVLIIETVPDGAAGP